jgi:2-dehydro-3-deoxyphosphogluconate aldolase / (4S)-4-hydroxy-2-oxoglutarate aldolase
MSRFTRMQVLNTMLESGIVPLYYNSNSQIVRKVIQACYNGGARIFEFTNRGDFAHDVFADVNKWCTVECPDMILGVGSIVDSATAALYIQLGANFIVSPILNAEIAKTCNRRKIPWLPGCGSVSEISMAEELGAEIVKIFPGKEVGGPAFVSSVKGPCPWTNIMPSGGVSPDKENLSAWFKAGAGCVGLGSKLFPAEIIAQGKFKEIEELVREVVKIVKELKK